MLPLSAPCPCGSVQTYDACCAPYHRGASAPGPETLMRSRFSAFALGLTDYLLASWDPRTRPSQLTPDTTTRWVALEIADSETTGDEGTVHFRATCQEGRHWAVLEERSRFRRDAGRWCYVDGEASLTRLKPGRNAPCPCASGRKYKSCCALKR